MLQPTAQGWPVLGATTQRRLFEWPQMKKTASNAELQGFLNTFKKFGSKYNMTPLLFQNCSYNSN